MPPTYLSLLAHFESFLLAYIHTLLRLRTLYPPTSFARSRFHNTPVYQSRHPAVCDWIRDAVDAVREELLAGTIARIGIAIYYTLPSVDHSQSLGDPTVLERFMLDVSRFPAVEKGNRNAEIEWDDPAVSPLSDAELRADGKDPAQALDADCPVDMSEQFRAALVMLTTRCAQLEPLPKGCSFNICMELKDDANVHPPMQHPQPWIPVQRSLQKTVRRGEKAETENFAEDPGEEEGRDLGGVRVTPIRTVEAGVFRFEAWVEEGRAKFELEDGDGSSAANSGV